MQKILLLIITGLIINLKSALYADDTYPPSDFQKLNNRSLSFFLHQPLAFTSIPDEMLFMGDPAPTKLSIEGVTDANRVITYSNILGYGKPLPDYQFSGVLANPSTAIISVQLKTRIGELSFSGNLKQLATTDSQYSYLEASSSNSEKYKLKITVAKGQHVLIKLNPTDLLPTLLPCYYIDVKEGIIEEADPGFPSKVNNEENSKENPNKDDLIYQIQARKYVIIDGDKGPGGKGWNFGGKIITLGLTSEGKNELITPENASEVESRIMGLYRGYKALGFVRDGRAERDFILMVDGKIEGKRTHFRGSEIFDLTINGKREKFFAYVTLVKVPFKTGLSFSETIDLNMYTVNMYMID